MGDIVAFNIRMPKEIHAFLRKQAFDQNGSINQIILSCVTKYVRQAEKKLEKHSDTVV